LLRRYDPDFLDLARPYDTLELPAEGIPHPLKDTNPLLYDRGVVFMKGKKPIAKADSAIPAQDPLIILLVRSGVQGLVRLPHEPAECKRVWQEFADFWRHREAAIRELIANRTLDEATQEKIYAALLPLITRGE